MFGFLRRRRPVLREPLQAMHWDGWHVQLRCARTTTPLELALDIDGRYFTTLRIDAEGQARCAFPFVPSGQPAFAVMPRLGRDGMPLAATPLPLRPGVAGIDRAAAAPAATLLPLGDAAQLVPFGVDVAAAEVAVVVPVYNAAALVERCLDSVLAWTCGRSRLIVIDDASSDPDIAPLLARYAGLARVDVLRNPHNLGFTATANRGIGHAGTADVVLLNADAEVGPDWLLGLRRAAHSADDVATVTAVSDNAGAFSVPELEQANALPFESDFAGSARALWHDAGLAYPALPTGNGFCLYIRRGVVERIGKLDESAFPQGYGEENDFCQRASALGLRHLVAGNVLVRHARSQSFGDARRRALGVAGMAVLRERYPHYEADVGAQLRSFERRVLDWRVRRIHGDASAPPRRRLLWVGAPPPQWPDAECWLLRANGDRNELLRDGAIVAANRWRADDAEASYRVTWEWLQQFAIEGLLVGERRQSALEILCGLLGVPILVVDMQSAQSLQASLAAADRDALAFDGGRR